MKVLELTQRFPPAIGGVEEHVFHLARGLSQAGDDVEVLTTDLLRDTPFERIVSVSPADAVAVTRVRAWKFFEAPHGLGVAAPTMVRAAVARHPEVLHAHGYGYFPTFAGAFGSALDGAALVITPHSDAGRASRTKRMFDSVVPKFTLGRARRVIAVSQHEAGHLRRLGVAGEKISVIPNGVELSEFESMGFPRRNRSPLTGLFVGRVYPAQKGLETLIGAVALLPRPAQVHFRIVGEDWGGSSLLLQLAERLGVADALTFVGRLDRRALLQEYANADFLVVPSYFEPFGIVILEGMAAELPVIASRVGGIPEVVADGDSGLLVEPGDPHALADAIVCLSQDEGLRKAMGRMGKQRARGFAWASIVQQVRRVYGQTLEERSS